MISSTVSSVDDAPAMSSTFGLKSAVSRKSNSPAGAGESGSTLFAIYTGMSS